MIDAFEDHCWKDVVGDEILALYNPYRRRTYVGPNPALLAIDLYNLVFEGGARPVHELSAEFPSSCGIFAWNALPYIEELFSLVRSKGLPVIYSTKDMRPEVNPMETKSTHRRRGVIDEHAYEIRKEIKPECRDRIIYKERASAFFGTPLVAYLRQKGIQSLIVCGESTSGCLRASVVDAYSHGFHTVVVEECCFDRCLLSHKVNLFDLHHKYTDVMHLEELKKHLSPLG